MFVSLCCRSASRDYPSYVFSLWTWFPDSCTSWLLLPTRYGNIRIRAVVSLLNSSVVFSQAWDVPSRTATWHNFMNRSETKYGWHDKMKIESVDVKMWKFTDINSIYWTYYCLILCVNYCCWVKNSNEFVSVDKIYIHLKNSCFLYLYIMIEILAKCKIEHPLYVSSDFFYLLLTISFQN